MPEPSEKILSILREAGETCGRKALQKKIYFAQVLGIDLGFDYKWYIYGPFSSSLADQVDFFMGIGDLKKREEYKLYVDSEEIPSLSPDEMRVVNKLKFLTDTLTPSQLELLASIHFLIYDSGVGNDKEEVFNTIDREKPEKFSTPEKEEMWRRLEEFNLI